jgi:Tol biopolymer transport system component/DNA-binding winged helix-turn-helix (wHTH) protein
MKASPKLRPGRLRFSSFELDLDTGELQKNGRRVRLQDQPARLLALLASRPGELVTRTEIQKALWEEDRIVEFDTAVNTAIKKVREALDDDPENPKLVETLPRKGYRFIALVEESIQVVEVLEPVAESAPVASPEPATQVVPVSEPPASPPPPAVEVTSSSPKTPWAWIGFTVLLAIAAIPTLMNFRLQPQPVLSREMRLAVISPPTADPTSIAISPDGLKIVFVAISEGRSQLRLRSMETGVEQSIAGADGALFPFWSPNSRSIGFFADSALKRVDIDSGTPPRVLADASAGRGGAWNTEDVILFTPNSGGPIFKVSAKGDSPAEPLTQVSAGSHRHPRFLPDGRHFLYFSTGTDQERGIYIADIQGKDAARHLSMQADAAAEYTSNHLLFVTQGALFAQSFDSKTLALAGDPFRIAEQVTVDAAMNRAALSVSNVGSMIYRTGSGGGQRQFVWYDRRGKELERVGDPDSNGVLGPALSPDGRHIAMYRTVDGNSDIWLLELERGVKERFTTDAAGEVNPVWSPDRQRIAFTSNRDGAYDIYIKNITNPDTELLLRTGDPKSVSSWSADGKYLLYRVASPDTGYDIWALPFDDKGKPAKAFPVVMTKAEEREAEISPDGKWIAYQSTFSGRSEIYIQSFPGVAATVAVSTNGGAQVRWGSNSELFYIDLDGQLMSVPVRYSPDGKDIRPGTPAALFSTGVGGAVHSNDRQQYVVADNGNRFLMNTLSETTSPITVILNWKGKN